MVVRVSPTTRRRCRLEGGVDHVARRSNELGVERVQPAAFAPAAMHAARRARCHRATGRRVQLHGAQQRRGPAIHPGAGAARPWAPARMRIRASLQSSTEAEPKSSAVGVRQWVQSVGYISLARSRLCRQQKFRNYDPSHLFRNLGFLMAQVRRRKGEEKRPSLREPQRCFENPPPFVPRVSK